MKKYIAMLLVIILALSFMSVAAFADGVSSPGANDPKPSDKPISSPQTGIGGNLYLIGFIALAFIAADALLLKKVTA